MAYRDYTPILGKRFGRWIVRGVQSDGIYMMADCKCDCGNEKLVRVGSLEAGDSISCGCYAKEAASKRTKIHGLSGTPEYNSYSSMVQRCTKPHDQDWHHYGGRGIKVCDRWLEPNGRGFLNFLEDMGEKPHKYEIDRIDVNGNYEPSNCRWTTRKEQTRNTRFNLVVEYEGESKCLAEWSEDLGIPYRILQDRLGKLQWPVEKAFTHPFKPRRMILCRGGDEFEVKDVFKSSPNQFTRAKNMGLTFYQFFATLFGEEFKVKAYMGQEWCEIEPSEHTLGDFNLNLRPEFEQYCRDNGLTIGGRLK